MGEDRTVRRLHIIVALLGIGAVLLYVYVPGLLFFVGIAVIVFAVIITATWGLAKVSLALE